MHLNRLDEAPRMIPGPVHAPRTLSIVHPMDPWDQRPGGFDTCLDGIIRYAPERWQIELIGLSTDSRSRPLGRWHWRDFDGRQLRYYAVLADPDPDLVRPIPLSLRFAIAARIRGVSPSGSLLQFHRFESGLSIRARPGQKAVYFLHNHPEEVNSLHSDVRWRRWGLVFRALLRWRLRGATGVIAVDPRTPDWAAREIPHLNGRIGWLAQWADPSEFHPGSLGQRISAGNALRERLGVTPGTRLIGFVGRLERQKDPTLLLRAFAAIAREHPDTALVLVGKGRLHGRLVQLSKREGLSARVHFVGAVIRSQLAELYRGFDVVACSSGFEAGPRVVFESLACGTPVVSFDVGQVPLVLRDHAAPGVGEIVQQRTATAFAEALLRALAQPPTDERVHRCVGAVAGFTPRSVVSGLFELYESWARDTVVSGGQGALARR